MKEDVNYFGVVRWCDEDIKAALRDLEYSDCDKNVSIIREQCMHRCFVEAMEATGWHYISSYIEENEDILEVNNEGSKKN